MKPQSSAKPRTSSALKGQSLVEYALILALIAIVTIAALVVLGGQISTFISQIGQSLGG